ncbi:MAG TPA: hypothetical protein PKV66_00070 [Candidatus Pelethenecus sp.]|nr:hypothetical protein [Candidatus Pelethenecus sp.]
MIKLYITAIESNPNGTAVTLFEDFKVEYETQFDLDCDDNLNEKISEQLKKVEQRVVEQSKPI